MIRSIWRKCNRFKPDPYVFYMISNFFAFVLPSFLFILLVNFIFFVCVCVCKLLLHTLNQTAFSLVYPPITSGTNDHIFQRLLLLLLCLILQTSRFEIITINYNQSQMKQTNRPLLSSAFIVVFICVIFLHRLFFE